jgi:hypothetical protein
LDWNLEPESTTRLVEAIGKKWILFGSHLRTDGILSIERKMIVAFHTNTLGVRGSETAVWDYANFNETILGNRSVLCLREGLCEKANAVFAKWNGRFPIFSYRSKKELSEKLQSQDASVLYQIKPGPFDGLIVPGLRNCIHSMFLSDEFHGDRFAYVSAWASRVMTLGDQSFVPHYVPKLVSAQNLRKSLGIPAQARVFGRHGGWETFNIPFAREAVARHARYYSEDHFIFLNTEPIREGENLPNIHYLQATVDPEKKAQFLASCDAMIHARDTGETFGLAVAEFAVLGKAVITFGGSKERAHLEMLGKQAKVYNDRQGLQKILQDFEPGVSARTEYQNWADPTQVMSIFRERFLS